MSKLWPTALYHRRATFAALLLFPIASICFGSNKNLSQVIRKAGFIKHRREASSQPQGGDFWHTKGAMLLDDHNRSVKIAGINWSGFETLNGAPGGLDKQDYGEIITQIKNSGFNVIRLPFSSEMVEFPTIPTGVGFAGSNGPINQDLIGLSSMEILDQIIVRAKAMGLKIILDNHRSESGSGPEENGLWFTSQFAESSWIADWASLAARYSNNSAVIGMDLRNEPHSVGENGACWDCGGERDWHLAAQRAGDTILEMNPKLLIFVEGVDEYRGDSYWWGGNLEGVRYSPVELSIPNQLVYSAHEYGPEEHQQPWFTGATNAAILEEMWVNHWAYISDLQIAPVYVGEFGTTSASTAMESGYPGSQGQWFSTLILFLQRKSEINWTYWTANGEDRYAYLDSDYSRQHSNWTKTWLLTRIRGVRPSNAGRIAGSTFSALHIEPPHSNVGALSRASPETSASSNPVLTSRRRRRDPSAVRQRTPHRAPAFVRHSSISPLIATSRESEDAKRSMAENVKRATAVATATLRN